MLLLLNVALYTFAFFWYRYKHKKFELSAFALLLFLSISILGFISFCFSKGQYFPYLPELHLLPFIYLFVMLMIALSPVLTSDISNSSLQKPSKYSISVVCFICFLAALFQLPELLIKGSAAIISTIFTESGALELYRQKMLMANSQGHGITNIAAILSNALTDIAILLLVYQFITDKPQKRNIVFLSMVILCTFTRKVIEGERGGIALILISLACSFLLFSQWIPENRLRQVKRFAIIGVIILCIPLTAITLSRFNSKTAHSQQNAISSLVWYVGQPMIFFNNYGLDAGGIRYGDRTALLFKKSLGFNVPMNYMERRAKYSYLKADDFIFYTFVGDFTLDYGPLLSFALFLFFAVIFRLLTKSRDGTLQFSQVILLYCCANVCCQGVIALFSYGDIGGNLKLVVYLISYLYFQLNTKNKPNEKSNLTCTLPTTVSPNS